LKQRDWLRPWAEKLRTSLRPERGERKSDRVKRCNTDFIVSSVTPQQSPLPVLQGMHKTLCQRIARFVRETLSFSKKNWWHETGWTHWFIVEYNLSCSG